MSEVFHFHAPDCSDYEHIATNGLAYTRESGGFDDWLKKGIPEPSDPYTVFAELRSVDVAPVLWATGGGSWTSVAFLATDEMLGLLRKHHLTGFDLAPVQIVKVATKGRRRRIVETGEPEDQIMARKNVIRELSHLPVLWGIHVTALVEIAPDSGSWNENRWIQSYSFAQEPAHDLFYPSRDGDRYGGHLFCSARFRDVLTTEGVQNVAFTSFRQWKEQQFDKRTMQSWASILESKLRDLEQIE